MILHIRRGDPLPAGYAVAYRDWDRCAVVAMRRPFHLLGRLDDFCRRHQYDGERLGNYLGLFDVAEGGYYRDGRWTLAFWRVWWKRMGKQMARAAQLRESALADAREEGRRAGWQEAHDTMLALLDVKREVQALREDTGT